MATYAPNFTARLKLTYTTLGTTFTNLWRYDEAQMAPVEATEALANYYTTVMPLMSDDFAFTTAEYSAAGSNFFLPQPLGDLASVVGTTAGAGVNLREFRTCALQFVGKSINGQPWRHTLAGALVAPFNTGTASDSDDFRITEVEIPAYTPRLDALQNFFQLGGCANDQNPVIVARYANIVISRYRINRLRRFG